MHDLWDRESGFILLLLKDFCSFVSFANHRHALLSKNNSSEACISLILKYFKFYVRKCISSFSFIVDIVYLVGRVGCPCECQTRVRGGMEEDILFFFLLI